MTLRCVGPSVLRCSVFQRLGFCPDNAVILKRLQLRAISNNKRVSCCQGEVSHCVYRAMIRCIVALASLLMYIYFCFFRSVNAGAFYHCVFFFKCFPWNSNDLPSRHGHNWYSFVIYSNIIIRTCEYDYRHTRNFLFSLLNVGFNRFSRWFTVVFPHIFRVVALSFVRRGEWLENIFLFCCTHLAIKPKWNDWIRVPSSHIKTFWPFPRYITTIISITNL